MDPNGRARRNRGRLRVSRAAGQQGQDSNDRKDSADFHGNLPSINRTRRPARRMTASEARLPWSVSGKACELEALILFYSVLRNDGRGAPCGGANSAHQRTPIAKLTN
jgi:hypothetical protein